MWKSSWPFCEITVLRELKEIYIERACNVASNIMVMLNTISYCEICSQFSVTFLVQDKIYIMDISSHVRYLVKFWKPHQK